jgi:adenylate kinase family enzyme
MLHRPPSLRLRNPGPLGRRILVWGPSGSGKTTLARELGRRLGLPVVELDALYHDKPDWHDATQDELRAKVEAALTEHTDGWVFDGNYATAREVLLPLAETVIWLRLPWREVYPRLLWRTTSRMFTRELLWGTNRESFRLSFFDKESILLWGITNWRPHVRKTLLALETTPHSARVLVLRSPRQVSGWLRRVGEVG